MSGDEGRRPIRRALISVYDKTGLTDLAQGLHEAGVDIVSTGSTAKTIAGVGVPVTPVEELTGFPEVLDGRVKTLHPSVHAGLLADLRKAEHAAMLAELGIAAFELVVVNLYPFSETVASGASVDECVEQIDIGGPSMVRAAAKNHPSVAVVVDPLGYDGVLAGVRAGGFTLEERKKLASLAFRHTAEYDVAVAVLDGVGACARGSIAAVAAMGGRDVAACRGTALRGEPASAGGPVSQRLRVARLGAGRAAARKRDVLQQLHRRRRRVAGRLRPRRDLRGDHQARQPVRHRDLIGVGRRRPPQGPRMRSAVRLRRRDRFQHRSQRRDGRDRRRHLHRGHHRARHTNLARWKCLRARRTSGCSSPRSR